jgi:FKBP-type peptidyl-prolyl cis-trans isomerase
MRTLLAVFALAALPLFAAKETPAPPADLTAPPADAVKGADGLVTKTLTPGTGDARLGETDIPRVRYTVWKSDGTLVQNVPESESLLIAQAKMIPGWLAAVKQMAVGETQRAWIPASLTTGKLKDGESFVFDTTLLAIVPYPTTPSDVAAPPADAKTTPSGLAYKVLRPGTGTQHPRAGSTVAVHYSGWTTDGKMFDSSVIRGKSATFPLLRVIAGWTEGLQLMVEGEQTRFWIPARLAYANKPGMPQGMLVFDVELLKIR